MASLDKSLDQMEEAEVIKASDKMYLVQDGEDKWFNLETLIYSLSTTTTTAAP